MCEVYASDTYGGGVVAIWDPRTFSVSNKHSGDRWIMLEGCINRVNFECCVGVIYEPNDRLGRNALFAELKNIVVAINKPILLVGHFNVILHSWERIETFRCDIYICLLYFFEYCILVMNLW